MDTSRPAESTVQLAADLPAGLGRGRTARAAAALLAALDPLHRAGHRDDGHPDRRRRMAVRPRDHRPVRRRPDVDRHRRHRAAGLLQPRVRPLRPLLRRADLHRLHAHPARAEVLDRRHPAPEPRRADPRPVDARRRRWSRRSSLDRPPGEADRRARDGAGLRVPARSSRCRCWSAARSTTRCRR